MFSRQKNPQYSAVFISPHFDDAVLSSCLPLLELTQAHQSVLIMTLFTEGQDDTVSTDAQIFLAKSKAKSAQLLFQRRAQEDTNALEILSPNIDSCQGHFRDALFRTTAENELCYPHYKALFSGQLHSSDIDVQLPQLVKTLKVLRQQVTNHKTQIWAPAGVGHHVDHVLTHLAVKAAFPKVRWWEDAPYHLVAVDTLDRRAELPPHTIHQHSLNQHQAALKWRALAAYRSQLPGLQKMGLNEANLLSETWYETT